MKLHTPYQTSFNKGTARVYFGEDVSALPDATIDAPDNESPSVDEVAFVYQPVDPKRIVKAQRKAKKDARRAEKLEKKRRRQWESDMRKNKEADPEELAKVQRQKALRKAGRQAAAKPAAVSLTIAAGSLVGFAMTGIPFFLVPLGTSIWAGIQLSGQSYSKAKADMNANYDDYLAKSKNHEAQRMQVQLDFGEDNKLIETGKKILDKATDLTPWQG